MLSSFLFLFRSPGRLDQLTPQMDDDYAQPEDLMPPSAALLDQVRDELGPWRNHSAVHAVIVDGDEGLVRVTFKVFPAVAAKCDLPTALWLGALRGRRVAVHHRPAPDDAVWFVFP